MKEVELAKILNLIMKNQEESLELQKKQLSSGETGRKV